MSNILVIGDTHIPFQHRDYLDFLVDNKKKHKCSIIVHIGDLCDWHAISAHEHDPDGFSPINELKASLKMLKEYYKAFPTCTVLMGNHDERLERAAMRYGLSHSYFRSYRNLLEFPKNWEYRFDCYRHNIRFFHGMGYSGQWGHQKAALEGGRSCCMGHLHSNFGLEYLANSHDLRWGMAVGCGLDKNSYAFSYGRDFRRKPILGCGVVVEDGKIPIPIPMKL